MDCPCGSSKPYESCCRPLHAGGAAPSAEALMRARYSAYVKGEIGFLRDSLTPAAREEFDEEGARQWSQRSTWKGLKIHASESKGDAAVVQFSAYYEVEGKDHRHDEVAEFAHQDGRWYFVDGRAPKAQPVERSQPKVGRNDPCPCGSGKKHKKCCGAGA